MKDDRVYLKHLLRCIARIQEYTAGGRESFFASPLIQDGVIRNLQTLAEASQHLSFRRLNIGSRSEGPHNTPLHPTSRAGNAEFFAVVSCAARG